MCLKNKFLETYSNYHDYKVRIVFFLYFAFIIAKRSKMHKGALVGKFDLLKVCVGGGRLTMEGFQMLFYVYYVKPLEQL